MPLATSEFDARAVGLKLAVFDVDGVLTDGRLYLSDEGIETKAFFSRDGLGLKALKNAGIQVALLTARQSRLVTNRGRELGLEHVIQGREDKSAAFSELLDRLGLSDDQTSYAGDDLVDWPVLARSSLSLAPADSDPWIRDRVDWVSQARAGRGAVREMCERILQARDQLDSFRESFR